MKISVFVIVHTDNKFLLIRESNPKWKNKWFLPGGKIDNGESYVEAAIRETKEEAGFDIAINGITLVKLSAGEDNGKGIRIFLSGRIIGGDIKTQYDEHSMEARWFEMDQIQQLEFRESIMDVLIKHEIDQGAALTTTIEISS